MMINMELAKLKYKVKNNIKKLTLKPLQLRGTGIISDVLHTANGKKVFVYKNKDETVILE